MSENHVLPFKKCPAEITLGNIYPVGKEDLCFFFSIKTQEALLYIVSLYIVYMLFNKYMSGILILQKEEHSVGLMLFVSVCDAFHLSCILATVKA